MSWDGSATRPDPRYVSIRTPTPGMSRGNDAKVEMRDEELQLGNMSSKDALFSSKGNDLLGV